MKSLLGTSSNIRSMGGYGDIHTLYGTSSLRNKKYEPDKVHSTNADSDEDDDYTPDYVGDSGQNVKVEGEDFVTDSEQNIGSGTDSDRYKWILKIHQSIDAPTNETSEQKAMRENSETYSEYGFHITSVTDNATTRMIQHPIEDGTIINDNKVNDPIKVTVQGWVHLESTSYINSMFEDARSSKDLSTYFVLETEMKSYQKLYMTNFSKRASTDKIDVFEYSLQLQELFIDKSSTDVCDNATYASSTAKGGQGS